MTVKVMDATGAGTTGGVADGIRYAAANGARIINLSLGTDALDPRMADAIAAANAGGALVVAAAGNDGRDIDAQPAYPAAIPAPNLIAVAATTPLEGRAIADFSNYGTLTVQLAAPGDQILSTSHTGGYVQESGTSMAAPMVSGVAALMASANPALGAVQLRALLLQNATHSTLPVSAGYVDALHSVLATTTAVGYDTTQPPRLKVLKATSKDKRTVVQVAVLGSRAAIRRYTVSLDRRRAASLTARSSPFTVTLRRAGKRVSVQARDGSGRLLASSGRAVQALRSGKRGAKSGSGVGT
jgi:subtilisin family serine protease